MVRYFKSLTRQTALLACLLTLAPLSAMAQSPTGTISGRITDPTGGAVAGAAVTLTSPAMQGQQKALTSPNGDYIFNFLSPGLYTVVVESSGFEKATRAVRVAVAETVGVNVALVAARVTEAVSVSADAPSFVGTVQAAASVKSGTMDRLPVTRSLASYVALAPGVHQTGPDGDVSIQGAMSFENLFLINGAVVQDNIRNAPLTLYIESALDEVTVATSGISAEYGRFSGGVVSAVTKSGGNIFSGSYRATLENDNWRTVSPFKEPKTDKTIPTHEFTFGGPVVRDRLWFFAAGRSEDRTTAQQTDVTNVPYNREFQEQRYEGNGTLSLGNGRRLKADYFALRQTGKNSDGASIGGQGVMDLRSLINRKDPMSLTTINYSGSIGNNLFVETQYSSRRWTIEGAGGLISDRIDGTPVFDQANGFSYWAPGFCGLCDDERNNDNFFAKGSYLLSRASGAHNITFGYDTFNDRQKGDNRQSGSDFWLYATGSVQDGATLYPVVDDGTLIVYWPLLEASKGTNYRTHGLFVNDSYALNSRTTINLGLRYDINRGRNASGQLVADGKVLSPRLGLSWDPTGHGRTSINVSAGRYVGAIANSIASQSSGAGLPAIFVYQYLGTPINVDENAPLVSTTAALQQVFNWYDANLGTAIPIQTTIPGVETQIRQSLKSPHADEYSIGISQQIGQRGNVRVDFVDRRYKDFYAERNDLTTGTVSDSFGQEYDLTLIENTNLLKRRYTGVTMLGGYRASSRITVNASYTLSKLRGNVEGEDSGSGPLPAGILRYPEYSDPSWSDPQGALSADQRHRFRAWSTISIPAGAKNDVSVGLLQVAESGTPYGAVGEIQLYDQGFNEYVANPGYLTPPVTATYFFGPRDQFRTAWMYRTDASVNYSRRLASTSGPEFFSRFQFINIFNKFQAFNASGGEINTFVRTAFTFNMQPFNPFTETPVQGINWDYGSRFGQVVNKNAYTAPFTFRMSLGFRF